MKKLAFALFIFSLISNTIAQNLQTLAAIGKNISIGEDAFVVGVGVGVGVGEDDTVRVMFINKKSNKTVLLAKGKSDNICINEINDKKRTSFIDYRVKLENGATDCFANSIDSLSISKATNGNTVYLKSYYQNHRIGLFIISKKYKSITFHNYSESGKLLNESKYDYFQRKKKTKLSTRIYVDSTRIELNYNKESLVDSVFFKGKTSYSWHYDQNGIIKSRDTLTRFDTDSTIIIIWNNVEFWENGKLKGRRFMSDDNLLRIETSYRRNGSREDVRLYEFKHRTIEKFNRKNQLLKKKELVWDEKKKKYKKNE